MKDIVHDEIELLANKFIKILADKTKEYRRRDDISFADIANIFIQVAGNVSCKICYILSNRKELSDDEKYELRDKTAKYITQHMIDAINYNKDAYKLSRK